MSLLSLKESVIASVPVPDAGRYTYFIDSISKQLYVKNSAGVASPVSNFLDTYQLYPATHSTSGSTSIYTLDLTGKPTPVAGKQINIKLSAVNTFGTIQITIPSLGTFNLFKVGGVGFSAGELRAGQIIEIIIDSGAAYYLGGFIQTNVIQVADTAALKALMSSNSLTVGTWYQFAFSTQYTLNGATVTATAENLFVRAVAINAVTSQASSLLFPQDIIEIDLNDSTYGSKIKRRKDPISNLDAPFDWRNVKFRRGKDSISGKYVESNPAAATFSGDFQDVYAFDNSQNGGGCRAIKIEPQQYNLAIAPGSTYANWGLIDTNIIFAGPCRNINIMAGCFSLSFYSLGTTPAQDPVVGHGVIVEGASESLIGQVTNGRITACKNVTIRGALTPGNPTYNIVSVSIDDCDSIFIDGASTKISIMGCVNVYIGQGNTSVSLEECANIWVSGSSLINLYSCTNSAFKNVSNSVYNQVDSTFAFGTMQERISASRNLVSFGTSGCSIESLKDAYQFRDKVCSVVAVQAGNPQVLVASIAAATFAEGDMVAVTNSIALLNKSTSIAFDTNADNIPDTISYPLVVADIQQFYPTGLATVAGNFYLLFSNNKFHLLFSTLNCPFKLDTNNSQFDGMTSNITKILNYTAGAIAISDPTNYDYGHVGILKVAHVGAIDILSQITHTTGKYPNLKRELRNNNPGNIISLAHGVGANLISMPGGLQRQLNAALDAAEIDLGSTNQWRVLRTTTADASDYAQRNVISLSAAQLQSLSTLPILTTNLPGVNKGIRLIDAHLVFKAGGIQFAFASTLQFKIGGVVVSTTVSTTTNIDGSVNSVIFFKGLDADILFSALSNGALQFSCGANSATGNGTATLVVNYRIIDLP